MNRFVQRCTVTAASLVVGVGIVLRNLDGIDCHQGSLVLVLPLRVEHGWPLRFMTRMKETDSSLPPLTHLPPMTRWPYDDAIMVEKSLSAVALNSFIGLAIVLGTAWTVHRILKNARVRLHVSTKGLLASVGFAMSLILMFRDTYIDWVRTVSTFGIVFGVAMAWYALIDVPVTLVNWASKKWEMNRSG